MKALMLAGVLALVASGCGHDDVPIAQPPAPTGPTTTTPSTVPATTVPAMVPSTIVIPVDPELNPPETVATAPPTTRRVTTTTGRATQLAPVVHDADFWYRLATCESGNGVGSANQFQFMGGTAEKVGYYAGASYEAQRAMAIDWAARIHPNEGTTAGWPVCWWVAGGS